MTGMEDNRDDIALSAYIDGELPDVERQALQERLLREPALARRLELLRGADADALRLYAAIDKRPMPQGVLDLLARAPQSGNVIAFPRRGVRQFLQVPVAIAASVALLAGFLVANLFRESSGPEVTGLYAGAVEAGSTLHHLLEDSVSAEELSLGDGLHAEILLTFEDRDGDYCRQLRVDGAGAPVQGIACRRGDGWQVEAVSIAGKRAPDGSYQQAGGDTPAAIEFAIDSLIGDLPPLDRDEESSIISRAWKNSQD